MKKMGKVIEFPTGVKCEMVNAEEMENFEQTEEDDTQEELDIGKAEPDITMQRVLQEAYGQLTKANMALEVAHNILVAVLYSAGGKVDLNLQDVQKTVQEQKYTFKVDESLIKENKLVVLLKEVNHEV